MDAQHSPPDPPQTDRSDPDGRAAPSADPAAERARPRLLSRRNLLIGSGAAFALAAGGGVSWALERFLIPRVEVSDVSSYEAANQTTSAGASTNAAVTADGFASDTATISIAKRTTGSGSDLVTYFVADIEVTDATVVQSAFAHNQFGENIIETTSAIAADHGAVFAINGDYYGFRSTGIEIRNGVIYRDEPAREGFAFYADGTVQVYDETATSADELLAAGVWNTLSFGPALLAGGQVVPGIDSIEVDTNFGNHSIQGRQPRTAVGAVGANHYVFVVVDGRDEGYSRGVTMTELAELMRGLGAQIAYNIDGGGSSTFYFNGSVLNRPSNGGERGTSDILYVAG